MKSLHVLFSMLVVVPVTNAQPALTEPPEFPQNQSGPQAVYSGEACFRLAQGAISPGDVDWIRLRLPQASLRTVIDVDFPIGAGGSALLAMVTNGTTGFNVGDNNNSRDALCGLSAASSPVGNLRDSAVDLGATSVNASIHIAVTVAADTSFMGLHTESFTYEVWAYALPIPCEDDVDCNDGVACTMDQCDVASGDCATTPDNQACDDDFFCSGTEWCDMDFGCRVTAVPVCDDDVECTDDFCDFGVDQCVYVAWNEDCDNGVFCDGEEVCDPQIGCRAGEPVDCSDGVDCTTDTCDEENWECLHTAMDDACDDGQFCNGTELCDLDAGCMEGIAPCPDSMCRESDDRCGGCLTDGDCADGVYCNGAERCNSLGQCVDGAYPCGASMCRESDDRCVDCLVEEDCADGAFCNGIEFCNPSGRCEEGDRPCSSGLCRETDDRCVECLSDADCDDDQYCNGGETCSPAGMCNDGAYPCNDAMCREDDDQCVECLADGDCDDSLFCNGMEQCDETGACMEGADPCGDDFCLERQDRCVECLTDRDCDDHLFCNGVERCDPSGVCQSGASPCQVAQSCNETADQCVSSGFTMDIRPGACPARVRTSADGYLPIAVVGADVRQINPNSVRLVRVDGVGRQVDAMNGQGHGPRFRDESGPTEPCTCTDAGPDGNVDLIVSFKLEDLVKGLRLENMRAGTVVQLKIKGKMRNGTPFSATDCVTIQAPGRNEPSPNQ